MTSGRLIAAVGLAAAVALAACRPEPSLPAESELQGLYGENAAVRLNGNVVEVTVRQPRTHLERGGTLWAQVGPYIYVFTPETQRLFERYPAVAAVRAITRLPTGEEIARATLVRDTLTEITWRRALILAGHARAEGSNRPKALYDLIRWGERYTEYRYSFQ